MATTKKFAQMSTKKLNALLETASAEDAVAIQAILDARNAQQVATTESAELSDEEKKAIEAAETAAKDIAEESEKKEKKQAGRKPTNKMTAEELAEAEKLAKENVGHRCSVILPGTAIRVDGTITTTLKDKRAMSVYYQVTTDAVDDMESRKVYKKFGSEEITILDEVVELKKKTESKARKTKEKIDAGVWDDEAKAIMEAASENIGKTVDLGEKGQGRIVSLLNDKRSMGIYYRIAFQDENGATKFTHKVISYKKNEEGQIELEAQLLMSEELDERGQELQEEFKARKEREPRKILTPEEKVLAAEEALKKAQATLEKAKETLVMRETNLALAKAELENKFDAQEKRAEPQTEEEEDLA